jgi:1-acyl-sn-glycerol-3-phosphate acyltransferase
LRRSAADILITLILWGYFTLGFVICFAPFYLIALLLPPWRTGLFQGLNHYFFRGFFRLCRGLIPSLQWQIDPAIPALGSSVIICNHISYIDSILLISLFKRHSTIVKERLFHMPIFGGLLKFSGYIPSTSSGSLAGLMIRRMDALCRELTRGAVLIVFPEGTRSRTGAIGEFNSGAFKIARLCRLPIHILHIRNSNHLFKPDRFLFNTASRRAISLNKIGCIDPDYDTPDFSLSRMIDQAQAMMRSQGESPGLPE